MTVTEQENQIEMGEGREEKDQKSTPYTPGPAAVDITPNHDGGVLKEILKEGEGTETPAAGDQVYVHYVGTLTDGSKFDSSRDRGDKFEFSLGTGAVIKAWDIGVASMKKGELAVFTCKPEYAYGEAGSPPKIPPNSTLVFEVELFEWKGEDVSEAKDEGVIRSQLVKGTGYLTPKDGASCCIELIGRHDGREFERREVEFVMGEGSEVGIVEGVEQGLKKFKSGEKSKLKVKSQYGYGTKGNEEFKIPPNADLEYEVELKRFEKAKESWEMDIPEKLEQSELCKAKGTQYFKAEKYKLAVKYYEKVIDYLKSEETMKDDEAEKRKNFLLAAHLNVAMCRLKMGQDIEAVHACDEALKLDPKSEKGLFRRGTANQNLQNFEDAVNDFKAVLEVDPNNKAAKHQLALTVQKIKAIKEKEKRTYAGMFTKFAQEDAKKEKSSGNADTEKKDTNGSGEPIDTEKSTTGEEKHAESTTSEA